MNYRPDSVSWWCAVVLSLSILLIIQSVQMGAPSDGFGQSTSFSLRDPLIPDIAYSFNLISILSLVLPGIAAVLVSRAGGVMAAVTGVALATVLSLLVMALMTPGALSLPATVLLGLGATTLLVMLTNALSAKLTQWVLSLGGRG